jgi:hypothetical protein
MLVAASIAVVGLAAAPAGAADAPVVQYVQQIDRQDIPPLPGSEPDTLVEPDVAVSPLDANIAVAAAHDGRYPDGGAVDISYAWTHDGGHTWHHAPVPGLTTSVGGVWDRASDPVLAFGPDGSAYLSALVFDNGCASGVTVSRSTDGGHTFGAPMVVHRSNSCNYSDDKNFLVIDNGANSPHRGRLYQFWTPHSERLAEHPVLAELATDGAAERHARGHLHRLRPSEPRRGRRGTWRRTRFVCSDDAGRGANRGSDRRAPLDRRWRDVERRLHGYPRGR